jgi:hypothetical protein
MFDPSLKSTISGDGYSLLVKKQETPAVFDPTANRLPPIKESIDESGSITAPLTGHPRTPTTTRASLHSQVAHLNKYLNDSGQPTRFRVAPNSADKMIQEINPATGEVIGEYSVDAFPALAKSVGLVGSQVDGHA